MKTLTIELPDTPYIRTLLSLLAARAIELADEDSSTGIVAASAEEIAAAINEAIDNNAD